MGGSEALPLFASPALPVFRWLVIEDAMVLEATERGTLPVVSIGDVGGA